MCTCPSVRNDATPAYFFMIIQGAGCSLHKMVARSSIIHPDSYQLLDHITFIIWIWSQDIRPHSQ